MRIRRLSALPLLGSQSGWSAFRLPPSAFSISPKKAALAAHSFLRSQLVRFMRLRALCFVLAEKALRHTYTIWAQPVGSVSDQA